MSILDKFKKTILSLKLKTKITLGVVILILFNSLIVGTMSYWRSSIALRDSVYSTLRMLAKEEAQFIRLKIDNLLLTIDAVASRNHIRSMNWDLQKAALKDQAQRWGFLDMAIVHQDGIAKYPDGTTTNLGDRDYVRRAFLGETNISDVVISRVTGDPVIMLASPIEGADGQIASVLIARLDGFYLSEITDLMGYGDRGSAYILTGNGNTIAHRNRDFVRESKNIIEESKNNPSLTPLSEMMKRMIDGEHGVSHYRFAGSRRIFGFAPIEGTNWSIAVGSDHEEVFAGLRVVLISIFIICISVIIIGIFLAKIFSTAITTPILKAAHVIGRISVGDLRHRCNLKGKDEIALMGLVIDTFAENMTGFIDALEKVGNGDLTQDFPIDDEEDQIGPVGQQMVASLKSLVRRLYDSIEQLNSETESITSASTVLSEGASSSAANLEEITSSITEIGAQSKSNAEKAIEAANLIKQADNSAEDGNNQMQQLLSAMEEIEASSSSIAKVIKIIEDIAFQTNLLALNAAVEAARAGAHGKGFAVVAEEVRSLASRSAKAARETAKLITTSSSNVSNGTSLTEKTAKSLIEILESVRGASVLMESIVKESVDQSSGVEEIGFALGEIDSVTQRNAELAEETASSSQELIAQAEELRKLVGKFTL